MHSDQQNTIRNPYRYILLFIAMVVIFADTGISFSAPRRSVHGPIEMMIISMGHQKEARRLAHHII